MVEKKNKPGMAMLNRILKEANVVIEVIDARDPDGTRLPEVERRIGSNRLIIVANKADLVGREQIGNLRNQGIIPFSARTRDAGTGRMTLMRAIIDTAGNAKPRVAIVGYPNVGKSSMVNLMALGARAHVSPVAGTTRHIQWIVTRTPEVFLMDSPGIFPPKEVSKSDTIIRGFVNVEDTHDPEASVDSFIEKYGGEPEWQKWIKSEFDLKAGYAMGGSAREILEAIAMRRGWLLKGGLPDRDRAARALLRAASSAPVTIRKKHEQ